MKHTWHFSTKLNFRDIQKCNFFIAWVPSYDLFDSARKEVFPSLTAASNHRLRNTWSSLLSQLVDVSPKLKEVFLTLTKQVPRALANAIL